MTDKELTENIQRYDNNIKRINELKCFSQKFHNLIEQVSNEVFSDIKNLPYIQDIDREKFMTKWYRDTVTKLNSYIQDLEMTNQKIMNMVTSGIIKKLNLSCIDAITKDETLINKDSIVDFFRET
jgi:hypothetical protein